MSISSSRRARTTKKPWVRRPHGFSRTALASRRKKSRGERPRLLVIYPVRVLLDGSQAAGAIRQGISDPRTAETREGRVVEVDDELNHLRRTPFSVYWQAASRLRSQRQISTLFLGVSSTSLHDLKTRRCCRLTLKNRTIVTIRHIGQVVDRCQSIRKWAACFLAVFARCTRLAGAQNRCHTNMRIFPEPVFLRLPTNPGRATRTCRGIRRRLHHLPASAARHST